MPSAKTGTDLEEPSLPLRLLQPGEQRIGGHPLDPRRLCRGETRKATELQAAHAGVTDVAGITVARRYDEELAWFRELEGRVKESRAKGRSVRRIVRELGIEPSSSFYTITFGDVTTANLVRSILDGPKRRVEIVRALSSSS